MLLNCLSEWLEPKLHLTGEERRRDSCAMDEGSYKGGGEAEKALVPGAPPTPAKEAPPCKKIL